MTQFRMRFYRDLHRLRYLVESRHAGISSGCFVAVVNEKGYVIERNQHVNRGYRTYHGTVLPPSVVIPPEPGSNGCPYELRMPPHEVRWEWLCERIGQDVRPAQGMRHFWLTPIFVQVPRAA